MEHREQTVEELKARLRLCAQKSNRRKSALKALMKSHELLQLQHQTLSTRFSHVYESYLTMSKHHCATPEPVKPWWRIWR